MRLTAGEFQAGLLRCGDGFGGMPSLRVVPLFARGRVVVGVGEGDW